MSTSSTSGYSGKPLPAKLGYQLGDSVLLINGPGWFEDMLRKAGVSVVKDVPATWVHGFLTDKQKLSIWLKVNDLNKIAKGAWFSWPKKASGLTTNVKEQTFRDLILPMGWVDTKVCVVDNNWSGLKFFCVAVSKVLLSKFQLATRLLI